MNKRFLLLAICAVFSVSLIFAQDKPEPWKPQQLISTDTLANEINHPGTKQPMILNVGPAGSIKGSVEIGPANKPENLEKLKQTVQNLPKDTKIVLYCGCCPFKNCPNIRPAFTLLNTLGFTNHLLLDIPKNLKADWIDHGFPMEK